MWHPFCVVGFDLECYSASGAFPLAHNTGDCIIQIATSFKLYGAAEPYLRTVVTLDTCDDVEGVEIIPVAKEADVINTWVELLRRESADVLLSYNGNQFDWRYVHGRAGVCVDDYTGEDLVDLTHLGRLRGRGGAPREWDLNSGAFGQNKFFVLQTPGVLQVDLLQYVRREFKLDSYSLNNVSAKYLDDTKLDLPAAEIFARFKGSAADRAEIARYAAKDTELPLRLADKLCVLENLFEMANAGELGR